MADIERLRNTLAKIIADPASHDQKSWFAVTECGTALCLAGHGAVEAGAQLPPREMAHATWFVMPDGSYTTYDEVDGSRPDESVFVSEYAQAWFGLTDGQAHVLFTQARTVGQLVALVDFLEVFPDAETMDMVTELRRIGGRVPQW